MASATVFPLKDTETRHGFKHEGVTHIILRRRSSVLGHSVSSTVGRGDVDGQRAPGLLDHLQHLELRLQLQAVAALTLHQRGAGSLHPHQPAAEGGQQLGGGGGASVLHREVDPSASPVHVHVGGASELQVEHAL